MPVLCGVSDSEPESSDLLSPGSFRFETDPLRPNFLTGAEMAKLLLFFESEAGSES